MLGHRKGSGIAGNPECLGVGALVGGVQCWLVPAVCVYAVWWWCIVIGRIYVCNTDDTIEGSQKESHRWDHIKTFIET